MGKVNLALLGGLRLQTDSGEPVPLSTKKAGALLAYLALHPGQAQARTKLATLLWGDRGEGQARDSLRQALSLVRKALSHVDPHALVAHEDTISFKPSSLATDATIFADLVAQPGADGLEQAVALYSGELFDGFQISAPEFESWATAERERFREMALGAMTRLLDHQLSMGAIEGGIRIAARLLAADPLQERIHRTLMELYCRQGRYGAALRQYRTCADLLAKELGVDPDATTKALRREILRGWNRQKDPTSNLAADAAEMPVCDVEIEPPATPRSPERQQATVLVCDLVDTGALASRLDPAELQALIAAYQRCCTPIISRSGGVVGRLAGTEVLAYFGYPQAHEHDVEGAVRAGLTLIDAVSRLDGGSSGSLQLRAGIATGPVVVDDLLGNGGDQQEIIGEAVQLAGALERIAEPSSIVIAASTRQLVGNLFDCDDLGQMTLNGVVEPVQAWRVLSPSGIDDPADTAPREVHSFYRLAAAFATVAVAIVLVWQFPILGADPGRREAQDRMVADVAVLPLRVLNASRESSPDGHGLAYMIASELARNPDLHIVSTLATAELSGKNLSPAQIAAMTHARYLVDGSAERSGDRLQLHVELIDSGNSRIVWSGRFEPTAQDLPDVTEALISRISASLGATVRESDRAVLRKRAPASRDVHARVLRAIAVSMAASPEGLRQARQELELAVRLDPNYAPAWACLGLVKKKLIFGHHDPGLSRQDLPQAIADIKHAIELDPLLASSWRLLSLAIACLMSAIACGKS